jgi:Fe-S-cluster containining protein
VPDDGYDPEVRVRCLSVHAPYVCAHAGACCQAGWTIPIEAPLVPRLRALGFRDAADGVAGLTDNGACVFFERDAGRLCAIQRRGGSSLLPSMCRHFPRVVVNDSRGTSVTLSHFCPTAAGLLFEPVRLAIVDAPAPLSLDGRMEGLDATGVLPPLLAPGVLTDWDGYTAWEEAAVALFDEDRLDPDAAARMLGDGTAAACGWRPGHESLAAAVRRAFAAAQRPADSNGRWGSFERAVKAFLAAHAFASWAAYEPAGLRAVADAVSDALDALHAEVTRRGPLTRESLLEAMRATDLRLRHAVDARVGA